MRHDAVMLFEISFGMHAEINDLFFRDLIVFAEHAAEELSPVTDGFLDAERRPPFHHGAFVKHTAIILEKSPALRQHFVIDHFLVRESKITALLEDALYVAR